MDRALRRKYPVGAEVTNRKSVHFRVWAPKCTHVSVYVHGDKKSSEHLRVDLESENNGYFSGEITGITDGMLYKYIIDKDTSYPDPASYCQPYGPHGLSRIVNHTRYIWHTPETRHLPERKVLYEMHFGTFTSEGTFRAAARYLKELSVMGINMLELMPVAEFGGNFGWGYDGVQQYAPYHVYGEPDDFKYFVDCAHENGMGVLLDIVYNHIGREGEYFRHFSDGYFSTKYKNEWGTALNFDQNDCGPVREYFISNAKHWVDEYRIDGFRFDATQQIFDESPEYLVGEITRTIHDTFPERQFYFIAENESQDTTLIREYGIDALWNDDFHRVATVALTNHNEAYFSDYRGKPQEFISCAKYSTLFQGQFYAWQKKNRGTPALEINTTHFVNYLQNHDQVANSCKGIRIQELTSKSRYRLCTCLLLLGSQIPLLFQGQEFGAQSPFYFFADRPEFAERIARGRASFLSQFPSIYNVHGPLVPYPHTSEAYEKSRINAALRTEDNPLYLLHRDLLKIRHSDPVFDEKGLRGVDGAVLGEDQFCIRYFGKSKRDDRLLPVNMGVDKVLTVIPEPLLAAPEGCVWEQIWYSEDPLYGGNGAGQVIADNLFHLAGNTAYYLKAVPVA